MPQLRFRNLYLGGRRHALQGLGTVYRLGRCRNCEKIGMLRIYQRDDSAR